MLARQRRFEGTKAGLFFELPHGSRFCCFIVAKFAFRNRPAVFVLIAPEWAARMNEQNHWLPPGEAKHKDARATFH